ncbi:MAG: Peptidyl-tRNA hydrolase [Candidatus Methanohalarchaeum thermophilum]|uniref:Peptidyl-tRNA hydrolase n=1 Tax=Methanohalarchaeum thermophilum TaxID=1903181 RepID=A0A1Q6DXP1_METT1|nr:MAG: Peptidyl-tRNA hydrolase [Candidatus Methanohalarchaeum thermophilum]
MKQAIVVRSDLSLSKGKLAAQVAHASVKASHEIEGIDERKWKKWMNSGAKKVILKVKDKETLFEYKRRAERKNLVTSIIRDAGYTELPEGTYTTLAIGPDEDEAINSVTGNLPLL